MLRSNVLLFMDFLSFFFFQYILQDIWFPDSWKVQNTGKELDAANYCLPCIPLSDITVW